MVPIVFIPAEPAPLIAALHTRHVVAPVSLLHPHFALGAVAHVPRIHGPVTELLVHRLVALPITVPLQAALKAHLHPALTLHFPL